MALLSGSSREAFTPYLNHPLATDTVADLRFGEGGGVLGKGLCVPKARSARGVPGIPPPWEWLEI